VKPYDPGRPSEIRVEVTTTDRVDEFRHKKGVEIEEPLTVVSRADDWWTAWSQLYF
jgi:D-amino peptidase